MFVFKKAHNPNRTLNDLDAYLNSQSTEPVKWLAREVQSWGEFSYAELEAAILDGRLEDIIDWQARYAAAINAALAPQWSAAIEAASKKASRGKVILSDTNDWVKAWLTAHGAELATKLSDESKKAIANVLLKWQGELLRPREMAYQIRPLIGLNERQAIANANYRAKLYQRMIDEGVNPKVANQRADSAAARYASKQHRYRAETIVNTELAFAYNQGAHEGVTRSIAGNYMNHCEMVWTTAGTNRVCGRCMELKDTVVGRTNESGVTLPPLHPRCRCAIMYRELKDVKPKDFKTEIAKLKQQLETQRAQGASPAEIEKTIHEAGRLVIAERKKVKIYNLPPEQQIDLPLLDRTLTNLLNRIKTLPASPERDELIRIYGLMYHESFEFEKEYSKQLPMIQKGRAEQLKAILSQVRQMGATKEQLIAQFGKSNSAPTKIFKTVVDYYPTDWIEASIKDGKLKATVPKIYGPERAYYDSANSTITVRPQRDNEIGTAVHEFGHRIEDTNKAVLEAEKQFYARRTAGEKLEKLRDITGNPSYDYYEVARKDKFLEPYIGKDYGGRSFELVSMGYQWAYTDPAMLLQDEDMAEWIFGMLAIL